MNKICQSCKELFVTYEYSVNFCGGRFCRKSPVTQPKPKLLDRLIPEGFEDKDGFHFGKPEPPK